MAFQYERLLGLCFHCGLLGHKAKSCTNSIVRDGEESPYGEWLRAGFRKAKGPPGRKQPSPPHRQAAESEERPQTGGAEMDNPLTPTNPEIYGVNGGVTDTHQPFISSNTNPIPSISETDVLNDGNSDIMDIMECRQRKAINEEYNQEAIVGKLSRCELNIWIIWEVV